MLFSNLSNINKLTISIFVSVMVRDNIMSVTRLLVIIQPTLLKLGMSKITMSPFILLTNSMLLEYYRLVNKFRGFVTPSVYMICAAMLEIVTPKRALLLLS